MRPVLRPVLGPTLRALTCCVAAACLGLALAAPADAKGKARGVKLTNAPKVTYSDGQSAAQREK